MKTIISLLILASFHHAVLAQHQHEVEPDAVPTAAAPHAGHSMPTPAETMATPDVPDPHAGHEMPGMIMQQQMPVANMDAHTDHVMPGTSGMQMSMPEEESPAPPAAFSDPEHAADLIFDSSVMAAAREELRINHGDYNGLFVMADRFEVQHRDRNELLLWDAQGWYGTDENRLWLQTEGEASNGDDELELQALWSHAFHPWFDFQSGLRVDFEDGFERSHLVLGIQGLMPYRFEVDTALFLSDAGELSARIESEYDWWLTQRLILQPRIELNLSAQDIPEQSLGKGLGNMEAGLRLRYQIRREFAPYFGIEYSRKFGATADYTRRAGMKTSDWHAMLGVQAWF